MTIAEQLGEHIAAQHDITPELSAEVGTFIYDYWAVTIAGIDSPSAAAARRATCLSDAPDATRRSAVHATKQWASSEDAAFVNGVTSHGPELDDTHEASSSHPGVVVMPAVFAYADAHEIDVHTAHRAIAVGYDVMTELGVLIGAAETYARGFHPTAVCGAVGAAAAVGVLMGLDASQAAHAVSLSANMAAGSLEFLSDGSWTKRLNPGHAAATGIRAARLARAGFEGPKAAFEGRDGFLRLYGSGQVEGRELGLTFGNGVRSTSIKMYPCCRYMHGNIDLLREIHRDFPEITLDDVKSIECGVITAGATLVSVPAERKLVIDTPVDAQFSMPFGAALALTTGEATLAQFARAPELAEHLSGWMEKVHSYKSARIEAAYPASWQAEVRLNLTDGTTIERYSEAYLGSPMNRATDEQIMTKAAGLIGEKRAKSLAHAVEAQSHAERFVSLLV